MPCKGTPYLPQLSASPHMIKYEGDLRYMAPNLQPGFDDIEAVGEGGGGQAGEQC